MLPEFHKKIRMISVFLPLQCGNVLGNAPIAPPTSKESIVAYFIKKLVKSRKKSRRN